MAAEAVRSGFLPVVVLGPSKVDEANREEAAALWADLEAHVLRHHPWLPLLDLREVEALDALRFAPGMGARCIELLAGGFAELRARLEHLKRTR